MGIVRSVEYAPRYISATRNATEWRESDRGEYYRWIETYIRNISHLIAELNGYLVLAHGEELDYKCVDMSFVCVFSQMYSVRILIGDKLSLSARLDDLLTVNVYTIVVYQDRDISERGYITHELSRSELESASGNWSLAVVLRDESRLRMERLNLGNSPTANIKGKGDVISSWI
ncbi:hypothetical protein Tco_1568398 [Tanacetum coccineum]